MFILVYKYTHMSDIVLLLFCCCFSLRVTCGQTPFILLVIGDLGSRSYEWYCVVRAYRTNCSIACCIAH